MLTKATVLGTGAMGTLTAQLLASNNVHVALLGRRPDFVEALRAQRENTLHLPGLRLSDRITPTHEPPAALRHTELVVSAVPCQHLRAAWEWIAPHVPQGVPVCTVTKGIETGTLRRPTEIIAACTVRCPLVVLSGPCIAPEAARCLPTTVVVACEEMEVARRVQSVMTTSWFRVYSSEDPVGVELAGALKNVIALAAGILDGLHAGDNAKAALLTRGLVEISRLGVTLGARPQTFFGLAGVGDLVTTCVSPMGRNRSAGERIGRGMSPDEVVAQSLHIIEGIPTTRAVLALARRKSVEMPITQAVAEVLFAGKPALTAITELMNRPLKDEEPI